MVCLLLSFVEDVVAMLNSSEIDVDQKSFAEVVNVY